MHRLPGGPVRDPHFARYVPVRVTQACHAGSSSDRKMPETWFTGGVHEGDAARSLTFGPLFHPRPACRPFLARLASRIEGPAGPPRSSDAAPSRAVPDLTPSQGDANRPPEPRHAGRV